MKWVVVFLVFALITVLIYNQEYLAQEDVVLLGFLVMMDTVSFSRAVHPLLLKLEKM